MSHFPAYGASRSLFDFQEIDDSAYLRTFVLALLADRAKHAFSRGVKSAFNKFRRIFRSAATD